MNILETQLKTAGVPIGSQTLERLYAFHELLETGNKRANLTAISGWEGVRDELIVRSLPLASLLNRADPGARLIDIGTGAGVPGLIMKIIYPDLNVTLVDATRKKIDFLSEAIDELGLEDVTAIHERGEDLARRPEHRECYDFAVARALGSLSELAEILLPFVAIGGTAAALKSAGVEAEAEQAAFAARQVGGEPAVLLAVARPGAGLTDTLVTWRKARLTAKTYPRRAGMPKKSPLSAPSSDSSKKSALAKASRR